MSPLVRPARPEDAAEMSRVLIASITRLCSADHGNDPQRIAEWTGNKSPEGVAAMLAREGFFMFVVELDCAIAGVGATTAGGEIALNYVAPEARFRGVSKALLARLEADLVGRGFAEGRLKATATARQFYLSQGWTGATQAQGGRFIDCFAMRKRFGAG